MLLKTVNGKRLQKILLKNKGGWYLKTKEGGKLFEVK